jgi:hypothetical protein
MSREPPTIGPNVDKLCTPRRHNHGPVFHFHMPGEPCQTSHGRVVAQHAVVRDMGQCHNEIMRSQAYSSWFHTCWITTNSRISFSSPIWR